LKFTDPEELKKSPKSDVNGITEEREREGSEKEIDKLRNLWMKDDKKCLLG